jgi:deoxyribose-phosphate aldolase
LAKQPKYPRWQGELPSVAAVAKMIDHSLLRHELTTAEVSDGLELAVRYDVASVCVRPSDARFAAERLTGRNVRVGAVVGFPHGTTTTAVKVFETREVCAAGADELDVMINIGRLRDNDVAYVGGEIEAIVEAAEGRLVKVIFENFYLTKPQKISGYHAAHSAGAACVKTSTGFAGGGATAADVQLMRDTVYPGMFVKAAGGARTLDALLALRECGACRFGATATATFSTTSLHDECRSLQRTTGGGFPRPNLSTYNRQVEFSDSEDTRPQSQRRYDPGSVPERQCCCGA